MTDAQRLQLLQRNEQIIEAVKEKAAKVCPGAVDLIAVTGSFHSGEFYEKSDLDLLIIVNSGEGNKIASCFILGDVAYDIYCHSWPHMEKMAEYRDPHVLKLLDVEIVYSAGEQALQRYRKLRRQLLDTLESPLGRQDFEKIRSHLESAEKEFAGLCLSDALPDCRRHCAGVLHYTEYALYLLNHAHIRHGIRGVPEEICALPLLPEGFAQHYHALIGGGDAAALREAARALLKGTAALIAAREEGLQKPPADAAALCGSYEEIFSNWKNKMHRAAAEGDRYLSLMTLASCQEFYDEFASFYAVKRIDLFAGLPAGPLDLSAAARRFDEAMEAFHANYEAAGLSTARYETMEDFLRAYLR